MQSYTPYKQNYVHLCSGHVTSTQLSVCQRMCVVIFSHFPVDHRVCGVEGLNFIGHTIDTKSLVWISICKSRFLALNRWEYTCLNYIYIWISIFTYLEQLVNHHIYLL